MKPGVHLTLLLFTLAFVAKGQADPCTRGQPEPVVRKAVFSNTRFQLAKDRLSAQETVSFSNGDQLSIRHWGCESYCLTFRFESRRMAAEPTDARYWYRQAAALLQQTARGLDAPVNVAKGIQVITRAANAKQPPGFGAELPLDNSEIWQVVVVEKVRKLANGRYAVAITYEVGPL